MERKIAPHFCFTTSMNCTKLNLARIKGKLFPKVITQLKATSTGQLSYVSAKDRLCLNHTQTNGSLFYF